MSPCLLLIISRRLASTVVDLSTQMKRLNDARQFQRAIALFDTQPQQQNSPFAVNQALKACLHLKDFQRAKQIHRDLSPTLADNTFIRTTLISLYMKCGDLDQARELFAQTPTKPFAMYTSMLAGLSDNNLPQEALNLFQEMNVAPDEYTFSTIFKICAKLKDTASFEFGKSLFNTMPVKFQQSPIVLTSALHMFMQCGDVLSAEQLFSRMNKNIVTFGAMMNGFINNKMPDKAIDLFRQIQKPDEIIYKIFFTACAQLGNEEASLFGKKVFLQLPVQYRRKNDVLEMALNMFIKCNDLKSAQSLFHQMDRNVVSYGSMMTMLNLNDEPEMTLALFERMKEERITPNEIIFTLLLGACSQIGDLSLCQSIVEQMPENFRNDFWIQSSLIDAWGKTGETKEAERAFSAIKQPNHISLTALINAYGLNGKGAKAVALFHQASPDMIGDRAYLCVLNACSHSGLVDDAQNIFDKIPAQFKDNRVYTSMVDAFSRSSRFDEAQQLVREYEKTHLPNVEMYMAMLSGTRNTNNTVLTHKLFNRLITLFPNAIKYHTAATVLLANTYASCGDYATASALRNKISQDGMKKVAGLSRTVVDGKVVKFRAHDRSHPRSNEIYAELDRLTKELVEHGYEPDDSWITRPLMDDETNESVLCGHSERLAIAFNLIQRPVPTRIQVTKNLRVCGDCHAATKLIARIRQCSIVVRDANRIHHFSPDGQCSCADYF